MECIEGINILKDYINKGFAIRNTVEGSAYNVLYFNLINSKQLYKCYTEDAATIDYIFMLM